MQFDHGKIRKIKNKEIEKLAQIFAKFRIYSRKCYMDYSPVRVFQKIFPNDHYSRSLEAFLHFQNYMPERRGADLPWWGKKFFTKQVGFRILIVSQDSLAEEAGSIVLFSHLMPIINDDVEYKKYTILLNAKMSFSFNSWSKIKNQLIDWNVDFDFLYITDAMKVYRKGSWINRDFNREKSKELLEAEIEFCNPNLIILLGASPLHLLDNTKNYSFIIDSGKPFLINGRECVVSPFLIGNGRTQPNFKKRLEMATNLIKSRHR